MFNKKKHILYLFALVSILYILSVLFKIRELELLSKPLFLPVLFIYYLKKVNEKLENLTIYCFIAFYIGEMLVLKDPEVYYIPSLFFFLIPYKIVLYRISTDLCLILKNNKLDKSNLFLLIVLALLIFLFISVILTINTGELLEKIILYAYGLSLILLCFLSVILYVLKNSKANVFLLMMVIAFIISDMYFIFIKKIDDNWVFKLVNLVAQMFSYYFFVNYSILKTRKKQ